MKISIVYDSITGNTEMLAQEIRKACKYNYVISYGDITQDITKADIVFIGSYTVNKCCSDKIKEFCKKINNKKVFIFGTCGFDNTKEYYKEIFDNTKKYINNTNEIIGYYYCQGKMQNEIKERYLKDLEKNKNIKELKKFINNFNEALNHPNEDDLFRLDETLIRI